MNTIPEPTPADLARDAAADYAFIESMIWNDGSCRDYEEHERIAREGLPAYIRRAAAAEAERDELLAELARLREIMDDVADNLKKRKREYE